jgi:osmoprotectant transport system substrate-binding protein
MTKTTWMAALVAAAVLALPAQAQTVKVGSKNFTEQFIVAEIYAQALEHGGFKVERKINLGGTLIAHKALTGGDIDLYPEYTGTALVAVVKGDVVSDPKAVLDQVNAFYQKEFKLTWLTPTKVNNGYAIIVRPDTAAKDKLTTLSSAVGAAKGLVIGAGPEFADRKDGLPGLKTTYGLEFKEFKQFAKLGLRYDALAAKQIDVANGFATDWQIAESKLVVLDDDKGLFPPYYLAPVVREDTLKANPKIADILNKVSVELDTDTMRRLNAEVERDKDEPDTVAKKWLTTKGLLK